MIQIKPDHDLESQDELWLWFIGGETIILLWYFDTKTAGAEEYRYIYIYIYIYIFSLKIFLKTPY